ncbi:MAG: mercuric ion transporter MerT [Vicinamibacterales bacterium]
MSERPKGRGALLVGGLTAILASTCCLGPLILLMLGISGAWIGTLTALEPYRPVFIGSAVVALLLAYRQIFRPVAECRPGEVCAVPEVRTTYKALFGLVVVLLAIALGYPFVAPCFY